MSAITSQGTKYEQEQEHMDRSVRSRQMYEEFFWYPGIRAHLESEDRVRVLPIETACVTRWLPLKPGSGIYLIF